MLDVYIQRPWKSNDSLYYKFLKENPPNGVKYLNLETSTIIQNRSAMKINYYVKRSIKKIIRKIYPSMPNAHRTPNIDGCDLIHCAHCLSKNKTPWITNIEYVGQFWASGGPPSSSRRKRILRILKSPHCKKIVAWTDWVKKDIIKYFPEIRNKIEIVYPGIPRKKFRKIKSRKIRLLFMCRHFYFKGGLYAVEAMDRLTKKFDNVEATVVADIPEEIFRKYSKNKKIKLLGMMPHEELLGKIFPSTDIFIYPSFNDTFGFPITEAMSFGLPVVGAERNSRRELIDDGKTGFLVKTSFEDKKIPYYLENLEENLLMGLMNKTEKLIRDKKLRTKMSKECRKLFEPDGKFSAETRNRKLKKVYVEALEDER
jgi:glycosyltransferase involved in cell wall biosynthesis